MSAPFGRALPAKFLVCLFLLIGFACKRPETAMRERPVRRVEVIQSVKGMTPEEEKAVVAQLAVGLGIPKDSSDQVAEPIRVFRLTLRGQPDAMMGAGLGKTLLVSTGTGALVGILIPAAALTVWATWRSAAVATGTGGLLGLGYGPIWYKHNETLQKQVGFLPWDFYADWEVLERRPGRVDEVVAVRRFSRPWGFGRATPYLDLKPHLQALPPGARTEADVRQASLKAYVEALVKHFKAKG